ncbi:putative toxin-antitoxin system toxin component, PIN family [Pseudoduganella sp. LjRoot289]|uniref:putative toxin-antitoxin system toxin component, PIN family n=1 Tax=Pseudoduganella sp. LjRoot289 TaxID=3342314 RepID=UPI003ECFA2FA
MQWVLDTNVVVSGALWNGPPRQILDAAKASRIALYTCAELLSELDLVLTHSKFRSRLQTYGLQAASITKGYEVLAQVIPRIPAIKRTCRDPDDDMVLACALAARADAIVTGDKDLLSLVQYQQIPILNAAGALALLAAGSL